MKRKLLLFSFLITFSTTTFCQDGFVDSLNKVIAKPGNDLQKISAQTALAKYYFYNLFETDSAFNILQRSISFAKNKKLIQEQASDMFWLLKFTFERGVRSKANQLATKGLQFTVEQKLPAFQADFLSLISLNTSNLDSAALLAKQALSLAKSHRLPVQQANALVALGRSQFTQQLSTSLKLFEQAKALTKNSKPDDRIHVLGEIGDVWAKHQKSDSAIFYRRQAISLAKENHDVPLQLYLLSSFMADRSTYFVNDSLDHYYRQIRSICDEYQAYPISYMITYLVATQDVGNYPASLKTGLECLKLTRKSGNQHVEAFVYHYLARVYTLSGNYHKAIEYLHDAEPLKQTMTLSGSIYVDLAGNYSKLNQPDSAKYYADLAYKTAAEFYGGEAKVPPTILDDLGGLYLQLGDDSLALDFLKRSYKVFSTNSNYSNFAETATYLAQYFEKHGPIDSVFYYAIRSFNISLKYDFPDYVTKNSDMIANYFYQKRKIDSAYYYQSIGYNTFKKLYNQENVRSFQNLSNLEQQREEDLARQKKQAEEQYRANLKLYGLIAALIVVTLIGLITYRNNRQKQKANVLLKDEKNKVESALSELKATQTQLIQSEKMASLGELTAGIAHEIQNPLNFVNNFSEVSNEMIDELNEELDKGDINEAKAISVDIKQNLDKINHHGKRADAIVKSMLEHSRTSTGIKEPTDINKLADEYLRLAYHGLRAKDKSFNAEMKTDFDEKIGKINIIPQDIGRVLLNLYNNAFYAVNQEKGKNLIFYEPTVWVSTKKSEKRVTISVKDNGGGIPENIKEKIFQPFFTTKPTGSGTGLGLSLAYDIVKAHGGEIKVETKEGEGSEFIILLPASHQ